MIYYDLALISLVWKEVYVPYYLNSKTVLILAGRQKLENDLQ